MFPAILVVGVSFALTQFFWSNYVDSSLVDIMGGVVSILATIVFLKFWKPRKIWRFDYDERKIPTASPGEGLADSFGGEWAAEDFDKNLEVRSYPLGKVLKAWMPFAILSAVVLVWGLAAGQVGLEPGHHSGFQGCAGGRHSAARPAGLGRALSAQCGLSCRSGRGQADSRSCALRPQLAVSDGDRLLSGGHCFGTAAGFVAGPDGESFLAHAGAHAAGGDCHLVHAGAGIRDPVFRAGCRAGPGVYPHRLGLSVFRHVSGLARSGADREATPRPMRCLEVCSVLPRSNSASIPCSCARPTARAA